MKSTRALNSLLDGPVSIQEFVLDRLVKMGAAFTAGVLNLVVEAMSGQKVSKPSATYMKVDNVAMIGIYGVIVPAEDEDNDYYGLISCARIRADLKAALADDDIAEIMLCISSPGGSVIGLNETAEAIRAAAMTKPICASIQTA